MYEHIILVYSDMKNEHTIRSGTSQFSLLTILYENGGMVCIWHFHTDLIWFMLK